MRDGHPSTLRLLLGTVLILALAGCSSDADRQHAIMKTILDQKKRADASPETKVFLQNLTGEPIRFVQLDYKSQSIDKTRSDDGTWQDETSVDKDEKQIWSCKYPDPLLLKTMKVRFENGTESEFSLNHTCKPGEQVLLILDIAGRMLVKAKE